jgi:hypothetical protein
MNRKLDLKKVVFSILDFSKALLGTIYTVKVYIKVCLFIVKQDRFKSREAIRDQRAYVR